MSASGFVAVIRRAAGGLGLKGPKHEGNLFLGDTKARNLSTYITRWPRHLTQYICFGTTSRVERQLLASRMPPVSRRGYISVAEPALKESRHLQGMEAAEPHLKSSLIPEPPTPPPSRIGLHKLRLKYERGEPLRMLTAYDYMTARLADKAGADILLVGDSLGMVVLGHDDTTEVTVDQMVHHCSAAARGVSRAFLVGDLPFGSYLTPADAAVNGVRLVKAGRVDAVKLEGGHRVVDQVRALVSAGIAVMGHIGLTPQSHAQLGGYRVQGRTAEDAHRLLLEARALQEAGCFGIVLECVPGPVAEMLTERLAIPTIGIGAGCGTSGQVQVWHDVLGLYDKKSPKFAMRCARLEEPVLAALREYCNAVSARTFPSTTHTFGMSDAELDVLTRRLGPTATAASSSPGSTGATRATDQQNSSTAASGPRVIRTVAEYRQLRASGLISMGANVGLVPTMGALHEGHLSLVRRARDKNSIVVASLFVNPTQFGPGEDFERYPRTWDDDLEKLGAAGVDFVFAPDAGEMYPHGSHGASLLPFVDFEGVDELHEARVRPGHFRGVATVVAKLLNIVQPRDVYFGQKDAMQCIAVRRMVEGLNFDTRVVVGETLREEDGLAMSSRNRYLDGEERKVAARVYSALKALAEARSAGQRDCTALRRAAAEVIAAEPRLSLEYVSIASTFDGTELAEVPESKTAGLAVASIAVRVGNTRLIDNVLV